MSKIGFFLIGLFIFHQAFCSPIISGPSSPSFFGDQKFPSTNGQISFIQNELYENSIDSNQYFIGSGDVFLITIPDDLNHQIKVIVDDNNCVVLPDFGIVNLSKVNLRIAKGMLREYVQKRVKIKKGDVSISLIKTKDVMISVFGVVKNPGTIKLPGKMRVLDAVKVANNSILSPISEIDLRQVLVTNGDSTCSYDLMQYIYRGNIKENPYLYPGDNIQVNNAVSKVFLGGAIIVKDTTDIVFPIKKNETVSELLSLFNATPSADTSIIIIKTGSNTNSPEIKTIDHKIAKNLVLQHNDMIIIPEKENYSQQLQVMVSGEVKKPGIYPMIKEETSLQNILDLAGGTTNYANLNRIVIIRRSKISRKTQQLSPQVPIAENSSVRPEINSAIIKVGVSSDYSIITVGDIKNKLMLEKNDEIVVPKKDRFIYISGNVRNPGAYEFISGKGASYYFEKAGGLTPKADKTNSFVISAYKDVYQIKNIKEINDGDILVIPDSQESKRFITIILPVFQAIVTTISVVFAIYVYSKGN